MESSIRGVPLLAAQMGPSNNTISGIRAPLTVDDSDFEGSVSSKSRRNSTGSSYNSGSEVEGYDSTGEDLLETTGFVEEVEGLVEKNDIIKEFSISEGAVVELNGERVEGSTSNEPKLVQESGSGSGNAAFRPFARIPSGRTYSVVGNFDDSDDSGSLLSDSGDDELVEDTKYVAKYGNSRPVVAVVDDEEVSEKELTQSPDMSMRVPPARKLSIPVAKISGDSDDDSRGSEVLDGEGFSGIARVPSIEVLHRIDSAPKVRMWEADEGDENESQAEDVVEMEFARNLVSSGTDFSPLDEKDHIVVENYLVQDNDPGFNEETIGDSLAMIDEFNPVSASGQNGDLIHLDEEIKEVDVIEDKESLEPVDHREPDDVAVSLVLPDISDVASVAESELLRGKLAESEVSELGSSNIFGAASLNNVDAKSSSTGSEDNRIFNHDNESENVERLKKEIDQIVESFSSTTVHEISSLHQCVDIKEVPAEGCSEFPELPDGHFIDASSTDAISTVQSVFEGTELEQETGKVAVASDLLPGGVEQLSFHSDDKVVIAEMDMVQDSTTPHTGGVLLDHLKEIDGQIVEGFDDEGDADCGMSNQSHIIDPALQADFCKTDDAVKFVSDDGIDNFSLGSNLDDLGKFDSARSPSCVNSSSTNVELNEALGEREKEKIKKIQKIRVKYLRLLDRLGRSPEDSVASKVLYQLALAAGSSYSKAFHLEMIKNTAIELESQTKDELDFSLSVLIIGKTGVGKSATINSIFGESSAAVDAFEPATTRVKDIIGLIDGVKLKVFDTPGLRTSLIDQSINRKILSSIKKLMKKSPPDVILYVDRLDTQRGDLNDLPLLRLVNSCLGSSIWRKSIVAFTHGTSVPPDGPNGYPLSYEAFIAKQSQIIERLISHSVGDQLVMSSDSRIPVCVIENHPFAEKNEHGENWRSQLLHLCCSMKILSEVSSVVTNQSYGELFGLQTRSPPLSIFLSSLLQSNVQPELSNDHSGEIVGSDVELGGSSDSDQEEDIEYDDLPLFKPLNSSEIARLSRGQRELYFDEYDYHMLLVQKKGLREEMRRTRSLSRSRNKASNETYTEGAVDQETEAPESEEAFLADIGLSPSFDGDDTSFRDRVLKSSSRILTRPVRKYHELDHDCSYDGLLIEDKINIAGCFPAMVSVQLTKDEKVFNIKLHSSVSVKHGEKGSTMGGLDILSLREKLAYTLQGKTKIKNFRKNKPAAGVSITFVGENVVSGLKVENRVTIGKQTTLVGNAGVVQSQDDAAYGVNFDLCRRDKDHDRNQDESSLRISVMKYKGDIIYGCNLHSHISISRNSKLHITAALNNMLKGKISINTSSSDQLQIAALALVPIVRAAINKVFGHSTEDCST